MGEIGKKLNYPRTSEAGPEATQRYARKLTRTLDEQRDWLLQALKTYIDEQISNINIEIGTLDHGGLTGLQDIEDHLYAFLHDGSRAFTAYGPGFSNDPLLADADPFSAVSEQAIKAYVDALLAYILASPVGTVIYIWQDYTGRKYLERLTPGEYGQVLTTGGANQAPFWAWVYEEPGAVFSGEIWFRVWMYAYVQNASIITMDVSKTVQAGGLTSIRRDNVTHPNWFSAYHPELTISITSKTIITMDQTKQIQATMNTLMSPFEAVVFDSVSLSDVAAAQLALKAAVNDAVDLTDYAEGSIV